MSRSTQWGLRRGAMLGVALVVTTVLLAACGGDDKTSTDETTTTADAGTTTTSADTTTTGGSAAALEAWSKNATEHRGENGSSFEYDCPAGGTLGSLWGTETYTDDSSVCTAAVHVGLITVDEGGTVTIEIQPGEDTYVAGEANGVISEYYGVYAGSFTFPDAPPGSGDFVVPAKSWSQTASSLAIGDSRELECSANGTAGSVWGTGTYTIDSSICTAAVLEGLITLADGGTVLVDVVDGESSYRGSTANGVTSQDYGTYALSFEFSADQP